MLMSHRTKKSAKNKLNLNCMSTPRGGSKLYLSFACAGWLKMYMFGVAQAFKECDLHHGCVSAGSSAGSLVGVALAVDADLYKIRDFIVRAVRDCRADPLNKAFALRQYVIDCFEQNCPEDGDKLANGRVETAVTLLPFFERRRYSRYVSREHLKAAVLASCCATPIAGFPFYLDESLVFDGGATDFQPLCLGKELETITVNPFYISRADIKPSLYVPMWWGLFPPSEEQIAWLFDLGRADGLAWIGANAGVHRCLATAETARLRYQTSRREMMQSKVLNAGLTVSRVILLLVLMLLKPLALVVLYLELWIKVVFYAARGAMEMCYTRLETGGSSLHHSAEHLRSVFSPSLFFLALPALGRAVAALESNDRDHRFAKLWHQSFVFRVFVHCI